MEINLHNYEAFFLDFHEGRLSEDEKKTVLAFVDQNPILQNTFLDFENIIVHPDHKLALSDKVFLKKDVNTPIDINIKNVEEFLIHEIENQLSNEQLAVLEQFIDSNKQFEKDRRMFQACKLTTDLSVRYPSKDSLKKPVSLLITTQNINEVLISESEGLLNKASTDELDHFLLENPQYNQDRELYAIAKALPDKSVIFERKQDLKKSSFSLKRIAYYSTSIAAALVMFLAISFLFERENKPQLKPGEISQQQNTNYANEDQGVEITSKSSDYKHVAKSEADQNLSDAIVPVVEDRITGYERQPELAYMNPRLIQPLDIISDEEAEVEFLVDGHFYYERYKEEYNAIKMADNIRYAELNSIDPNPVKTLFRNASGRIATLFVDDRRSVTHTRKDSKIDLWDVAQAGVFTYNNLTKKEVELDLLKDDNGQVVAYQLKSDLFSINRDVKVKE